MTACLKPAEGKTHFPVPRHLLNLHAGSLQRGVNIQPSLLPLFQSFTTEQQLGADEHGAITNVGSVGTLSGYASTAGTDRKSVV